MDFNLKILKYNITLALILSGIFYTKHPEQVHEYIFSLIGKKEEVISHSGKKIINPTKSNRGVASVGGEQIGFGESISNPPLLKKPNPFTNKDSIEEKPDDSANASADSPLELEDENLLDQEDKTKEKTSALKKVYNKIKQIAYPNSVKNDEKEESIGFWGGWFNKKNDPIPSSTTSGSSGRSPAVDPCTKPVAPQQLVSSLVSNQANLSWQNLGAGITYNVFRGIDSSNLSLIASQLTNPNYTDSSITPGLLYYYKVSSGNSCGYSLDYSNQSQVKSLGSFTILSSLASADSLSLTWSESLGAESYLVYYGTTSGVYSSSVSLSSPATLSLLGGNTYFIKVQAVNLFGTIDSSEISIYIPSAFSSNITFDNLIDYSISEGLKISNSKASLESSNLVSEKTIINGTGVLGDNVFDDYTYIDSNLLIDNDSIKMSSGTTGTYISKVFDGKNNTSAWSKMNFITSLPFGKEIALSPESNYQESVTDFSNQLTMLYHFNGTKNVVIPSNTSISSPVSGHSALSSNSDNLGMQLVDGVFKQSLRLDGVNDYLITNYTQTAVTAYTVSVWMRTSTTGSRNVFIHNRGSGAGKSLTLGIGTTGGGRGGPGRIGWELDSDMIDIGVSSTQSFNDGLWHHVVGTWSANSGVAINSSQFKIYVDGILVATSASSTGSATSPLTGLGTTIIGYHQPWNSYFAGDLDEIAVWNKSLTLAEIQELYIRGANKVKLQIRTCSEKTGLDCSGTTSSWVGIDGTNSTYFSEQENNISPLASVGEVTNSFFQTPFSLFTGGLTSWLSIGKNGTDRYIQYKAVFESSTNLSYPDLYKVSFEPANRYALSLIVSNRIENAIDLNYLSGLIFTQSCFDSNSNSIDDDIKYELSLDAGVNYYAYQSGGWILSNSSTSANTKSELEALTSNEFKLIPLSTGKLIIRSYLTSDGIHPCEIDNIQINGAR